MSLSQLSTHDLRRAVELLKARESLQSQIENINHQLRELEDGYLPASDKNGEEPTRTTKRRYQRRRKNRQESVLEALKNAGEQGLSVNDLAAQTGKKTASLRVWLYTTGKTISGLKKIAPGRFALMP